MNRLLRASGILTLLIGVLLLGPFAVWATGELDLLAHWSHASRERAGLAPDPALTDEPVVQVYAARAWGWRGLFAVHSWVAAKPAGAARYTIYQVTGWSLRYGAGSALRVSQGMPDRAWYGNPPQLLAEVRGARAERALDKLEQAVAAYPFTTRYGLWPGPNSNTFVAWIGRQVPELRLALPVTAIGKDFLSYDRFFDRAPSGTGVQLSLWGLFGITLAAAEGVELNLLGLSFGLDFARPALKWPGVERLGVSRAAVQAPPPARAAGAHSAARATAASRDRT